MNSDEIHAVLDQAHDLLEAGQPADAVACLKPLEHNLVERDHRIEYAAIMAWSLSELQRGNEALDILDPLLEEFQDSARLHGALGIVLSNDGELEEASRALDLATTLDPSDEVALANLGLVYEKMQQFELALTLYNRAIDQGAEIDWLLQRTAAVQAELGDYAEARSTLKRYLSLVPEDVDQWITLAILHSDDFEYEEAFACYRAAEQIAPDSTALRMNWGVTAVRAERIEIARQQLKYLARLEPDMARPLLLEAFIHEERNETEEAEQRYAVALERMRSDDLAELTYTLEMVMDFYVRRQNSGECKRLLRKAYQLNACTIDLCQDYRELFGKSVDRANWYSMVLEADYRTGLTEIVEADDDGKRPPAFTRYLRHIQVIAADHDEALAMVMRFAREMGEKHVQVREFINEEVVEDVHTGIYEVERESLVFADNGAA